MSRLPKSATKTTADPLPDRSLEPPVNLPTVAIRSAGNHPFVYKKMIAGPVGTPWPKSGDLVKVVDRDGFPIGFGLWNPKSQIALRIITQGIEPPGRKMWADRVENAVNLRREVLKLDAETNAYRVLHAEADGLSGMIVDRFDDVLSAEIFSLGMYQRSGAILGLLAEKLGTTHARIHVDERIALAEDFPGKPASTPDLPPKVTIHEHGIRYRVRFEGGHKTGFFCDQRDNRRELAKYCKDRTVLDLCCYTAGFSLNALIRGDAREATAVDLDEKAIAVAKENANLNQVKATFVHADAFGYARQMGVNARSFGVVIVDPSKLIPGRLDVVLGKKKYFDLNFLAMRIVEENGLMLTCSCSGLLSIEEFLVLLRAAARKAGRSIRVLAIGGASPDHPVGLEALEGAYLKAVWLWVGEKRVTRMRDQDDEIGEEELGDE